MEKPISRPMHGFSDWSYIPIVAAAADLFDFRDEPAAVAATRACSGAVLLSTLFTRAEWGLFRTMSYRNHLNVDAAVGAFALAAPWLFGFSGHARARRTLVTMGLLGLANGLLLSRPEEMPTPPLGPPHPVHR